MRRLRSVFASVVYLVLLAFALLATGWDWLPHVRAHVDNPRRARAPARIQPMPRSYVSLGPVIANEIEGPPAMPMAESGDRIIGVAPSRPGTSPLDEELDRIGLGARQASSGQGALTRTAPMLEDNEIKPLLGTASHREEATEKPTNSAVGPSPQERVRVTSGYTPTWVVHGPYDPEAGYPVRTMAIAPTNPSVVHGPYDPEAGYPVRTMAIAPTNPSVLYASADTDEGGTRGLHKTTNGGDSWSCLGFENTGLIYRIVPDPLSDQTVYICIGAVNPLGKSTDGGQSWVTLDVVPDQEDRIKSLAISPVDSSVLYAGRASTYDTPGGVFKSTDGGTSWSETTADLADEHVDIRGVIIDSHSPSTIYAWTRTVVLKSANEGVSWMASSTGLSGIEEISQIVIDPFDSNTLWLVNAWTMVSEDGLYKSTDGGITWQVHQVDQPGHVNEAWGIAMDPLVQGVIYADTNLGLLKTQDSGLNWSLLSSSLAGGLRSPILIDPENSQIIYARTDGNHGVRKSTDGGQTWFGANHGRGDSGESRAVAVDPTDSAVVYAGGSLGVCKSSDGGSSWLQASNGIEMENGWDLIASLAVEPDNTQVVYAGAQYGRIYRSADGGDSWELKSDLDLSVDCLLVHRFDSALVYAGTAAGIYRSADGGTSWTRVTHGLDNVPIRELQMDSLGNLYAATAEVGILKSTDAGNSWEVANSGLTHPMMCGLTVSSMDSQTMYAGGTRQLYRSLDGGQSWSELPGEGKDDERPVADPRNSWLYSYGGYVQDDIHYSQDRGYTWHDLVQGLDVRAVNHVTIAPTSPYTMYAATDAGVYVLPLTELAPIPPVGAPDIWTLTGSLVPTKLR